MQTSIEKTISVNTTFGRKTKKNKNHLNNDEKERLWAILDMEKQNDGDNDLKDKVEETDFCEKCNNIMIHSEEGFTTCTNKECGIMHNYCLDYSPEWRYFTN